MGTTPTQILEFIRWTVDCVGELTRLDQGGRDKLSALQNIAAKRVLSPDEWEERLVAHYLRSDGPSGGAPLTFLDATPAEIAIASGIANLDENSAQQAFLAHFDSHSIHSWLSGEWKPPGRGSPLPGYFRYLVLTALVSATETGAGETQNFRVRLGELLRCEGQFSSVSGVNSLWRSIVDWCSRRRAAGEPFRRVKLPSFGNANLIGYAVRIAFPSWRDRNALTRIMRPLPFAVRRSPERLVQELTRSRYAHELPDAVNVSLIDFGAALRGRSRMLLGHRFWRLASSIDLRLSNEEGGQNVEWWRLDVQFSGWEMDVARLKLFRGRRGGDDRAPRECALQELEAEAPKHLPIKLAKAFRDGVLILAETPGMVWRLDDESPPDDASAIVVARDGGIADNWAVATEWRRLEGPWRRSGRIDADALKELRRRLGLEPAGARLVDLTFSGGVKTSRTTWLGRPGLLPSIVASATTTVGLEPIKVTQGNLELRGQAPVWSLATAAPTEGRWRVLAQEELSDTDKVICFEPEMPERWEFPEIGSGLEVERDVVLDAGEAEAVVPSLIGERCVPGFLDDILEAIYTAPPRGWSEGDLVEMLLPLMPHEHFIWDFLRGLAEAGWLEPLVLTSWRARLWRLKKPHLRDLGSRGIVAAGALGLMARRRLARIVDSMGGDVTYLAGVSEWAVPLPLIQGVDAIELAKLIDWNVNRPRRPRFVKAPKCWLTDARSGNGRNLAGTWSFETGLFHANAPHGQDVGLSLERLVRENGDDRDIYRVIGGGEKFITSSRTAAIIESHRRLRFPLFAWTDGKFRRLKRGGYLPLEMAQALVSLASCASGPLSPTQGKWSYAYPADLKAAERVERALGPAVHLNRATATSPMLDRIVRARRNGRAASWYDLKKNEKSI
jgi:hypothetical protein